MMSTSTGMRMIDFFGSNAKHYIWHGAEPLTQTPHFYSTLCKKLSEMNVTSSMQTSGIGLTQEFADLFCDLDVQLGFSLDGPEHVHDLHRGTGSFKKAMRSIDLIRSRGARPGVIAVLSKKTLPHIDETYNFFKSEGFSFKINPIMKCGNANDDLQLTSEECCNAIIHLFDRWIGETEVLTNYTSIESVVAALVTGHNSSCDSSRSCQNSFVGVDVYGNLLPCSRFSKADFTFGNIRSHNYDDLLGNDLRNHLIARFEEIDECSSCEFNSICYAGCMHLSYINGDIMQKDPHCSSNKKIFSHIRKKLDQELKQ